LTIPASLASTFIILASRGNTANTPLEPGTNFGILLAHVGFGEKNQWDWNGEAVAQVGDLAMNPILAWTGKSRCRLYVGAFMEAQAWLKADIASGDNNPTNGRREPSTLSIFKSGYFNDASLIRPETSLTFTRTSART